eukprot:CAMPEP_0185263196 /NCGR_PEP_ID=MMETSP1359-20130426/12654_1 /TAXON_ID=552665 /ORGANISM="Bigelowiella longifila, Strain CCMP242" /LENGTH=318 /DNA_ID=CAMNT_0027850455 /DNA_START=34 /DNA_END=990 /DNA_ORIENTATION=+
MAFVPVKVGDYIKKFKDLLGKKYKKINSNDLVVKTSDGSGMDIETTIMSNYPDVKSSGSDGSVKITYKCKPVASKLEVVLDTQSKFTSKLETTSLADGLTLTGNIAAIPAHLVSKKLGSELGLEAAYKKEAVTTSAKVSVKTSSADKLFDLKEEKKICLDGALSAAVAKGVSVGMDFSAEKGAGLNKWGLGTNVSSGALNFGIYSSQLKDLTTGFLYKCSKKTSFGAQGKFSKKKDEESEKMIADLGFGVQHQFNDITLLQGKTELNLAKAGSDFQSAVGYGAVMEYSIPDMSSKLQLTSTVSAKGSNFGILCTYGDK